MITKSWGPEFVNALNRGDWGEAIKIKNASLPEKIYKYFPLFDEKRKDYLDRNAEKLESLINQKIWVSSPEELNDPFEMKVLTLDTKRIAKDGGDVDLYQRILDLFTKKIQLCCFSNSSRKRLPLWAHYANNHQGFCIEYGIKNKDPLFPVRYSSQRIISRTIVTNLCNAFLNGYQSNKKLDSEFWHYYQILFLTFCTKSSDWQYEHEFRFIDSNRKPNSPGELLPLFSSGLTISKIFLGIKCSAQNEKELVRIGKILNIPVYKMRIVDYSKYFSLRPFLVKE